MRILFDATARRQVRRPFALGVLTAAPAPKPATRAPFTAADLAFWAENAPSNATGYDVVGLSDAELERRAQEAAYHDQFLYDQHAAAVRKGTGVRLDAAEEAARYGVTVPFSSPEAAAEHAAGWDAYHAWQAAYDRFLAGRGPHPDTVA